MNNPLFDKIIDRRSAGAMKWTKYGEDTLPLWVADADFQSPEPIREAIRNQADYGVFGYHKPEMNTALYEAVAGWLERRHQWRIEPQWLVWLPGLVSGFHIACRAFCSPGDKVLVQTPNYPPLLAAPGMNQLEAMTISTRLVNGRWELDLEELAEKAADPRCKLFIFCNPMNPCGSVFTSDELAQIEEICLTNGVQLCSDEIHCDLLLDPDAQHIPAGTLPAIGEQAITLIAPSKTFNIAGLGSAFAVIRNPKIRRRFHQATLGILPWINNIGQVATIAAFNQCDNWLEQQLIYLRKNRDYLKGALNSIPGLSYAPAQATYLAWVDASGLNVTDVHAEMLARGIAPSPGADFGNPQFMRLNFACPQSYLEQAVDRISSRNTAA